MLSESDEVALTTEEKQLIFDYDSRLYGFLNLDNPDETAKKALLTKALTCLERSLAKKKNGESTEAERANVVNPQVYRMLGHLNLLLEDFSKALSAYQKFFLLQKEYWKDAPFLYGIGLVYFHFNAYQWAIKSFQQLLYTDASFSRANEVHLRLGLAFKINEDYDNSVKHFRLALNDSSPCSLSKSEIEFHLAHVKELEGKHKEARVLYERLLETPDLPVVAKSAALRQLGWMFHTIEGVGDSSTRETQAIQCLQRSIDADATSGQTWYFLGRCFSSIGKVHDAFVSYRHSIDKSEASADTWCSIGVLYQQQSQPMDALQAYICAVQLDKSHIAAWMDLGVLYESCSQPNDALTCYVNASKNSHNSVNTNLTTRIKVLQQQLSTIPAQAWATKKRTLPSIDEAWSLPIPAELTSRQGQGQTQGQQCSGMLGEPTNNTNSTTQRNTSGIMAQAQLQQHCAGGMMDIASLGGMEPEAGDIGPNAKRRKTEHKKTETPQFYLNQEQIQMLNVLQQNQDNLSHQQQQLLNQLQQQYNLQQQHQQIIRSQGGSAGGPPGGPPPPYPANNGVSYQPSTINGSSDPSTKDQLSQNTVSDQELTALLSRHDIATSLAEDILAQFAPQPGQPNSSGRDSSQSQPNSATGSTKLLNRDQNVPDSLGQLKVDPVTKERLSPLAFTAVKQDRDNQSVKNEFKFDDSDRDELRVDSLLGSKMGAAKTASGPKLNINMTASQILNACRGHGKSGCFSNSVLSDQSPPPMPPEPPQPPLPKDQLNPPTPSVYLEAKKDAFSVELQQYCLSQPVAVIRGLAGALKLDLGLFSTKSLVEQNSDHPVEIRTQVQQPPEENMDASGRMVWGCSSSRSHTTVMKYAQYQAASFQESLREDSEKARGTWKDSDSDSNSSLPRKKNKMIKFGTNLDMSDEKLWKMQLSELTKLPTFCRLVSASNQLSHIGHTILGMNAVQLYMKVPGSRTPGHQENNNYCAVNINIGPGDTEWFCTPEPYWGTIHALCEKNNINYLSGSWWPNLEDLYEHNVPVYRFIQKPGDLVWIGPGTVHWVQAIGWCNNIAWNVGPLIWRQYQIAIERYEYNKLQCYKSIVPMTEVTWNMARNMKITEPKLYELMKTCLMRTLRHVRLQMDFVEACGKELKPHPHEENEDSHYCNSCDIEVFDILYVIEQDKKFVVHCLECARRMSPKLEKFVCLFQYDLEDLIYYYDSFNARNLNQITS